MTTMTSPSPVQTYTPDDLLAMADAVEYELVDGHLVERNVSIESSGVALQIGTLLNIEAKRTGLASVYGPDLGYQSFAKHPNRIRKPDVSVVRKDRLKELQLNRGYMPIPADLAVEVVSPNDSYYEVAQKVAEYLEAGFGMVWVVDPNLKTVRIERAGGAITLLHENDGITAEPVLPEFRCKVGEFFKP
ncbi:MAG TPA: Uma2 family endonuclease [Tepidisphaeraceae bacterium]|nr:Uma2 family endonuclease [Tepidisphaeraceae bacterium]